MWFFLHFEQKYRLVVTLAQCMLGYPAVSKNTRKEVPQILYEHIFRIHAQAYIKVIFLCSQWQCNAAIPRFFITFIMYNLLSLSKLKVTTRGRYLLS